MDNGNLVTDLNLFGDPGIIAVDVDWANTDPVWLEFTVESGDLDPTGAGGLVEFAHTGVHPSNPFNLLGPMPGTLWSDYHVSIDGGPIFLGPAIVFAETTLDLPTVVTELGIETSFFFDVPESSAVTVLDFIDLGLLDIGDTFTIHIFPTIPDTVIPEPSTATIGLLGLGVLITRRRRSA